MKCEKAKKLIIDYVYQELSDKQRKKLEKHIAHCWGCSFELESFQKTIHLVQSQTEVEESEQFWEERWSKIEERLPPLEVAVKDRSLFGQVRHWLWDRMPPSDWIFHELMLRKALPAVGMVIFVVCVSLLVIHTLRTKLGRQNVSLSSVEQVAKEEAMLELPKHNEGNGIQVKFYLLEHERSSLQLASIQNASLSHQPQQQFSLRRDDLFYYDMVGGVRSESGLIMKGRSDWHESSNHGADDRIQGKSLQPEDVSDKDTISLEEAQRLVSFDIIAPSLIDSNYTLIGVRKIKDRECIQVLYSNGADVFSLFQQPIGVRERLDRWDFREYIVASGSRSNRAKPEGRRYGKNGERTAVLGWYTGEFVFNLVGEVETSRMMGIADEIRNYYLMDGVREYYREYTERGR